MKLGAVSLACTVMLVSCGQPSTGGSKQAAPSRAQPIEITTKSGAPMILVPGGSFVMGSSEGADDEAPTHTVTISPFAMDKYEVTQDQFAAAQEPNPSHFKGPRRPVEQVRWSDAALFCNTRSRIDGLEPCYDDFSFACNFDASGYRLPTEAEWEYAARAGTDTAYGFGNDGRQLKAYACYDGTSTGKTDDAGRKRPNRWGFHDLYGNVAEWCHDVYGATYYAESPEADPRGPAEGAKRVMRGGAWNSSADACRATIRSAESPGITDACFARDTFGFRCVRRLTEVEAARIRQ